ncbi:MAG TPA: hypothetical protein DCG75_06875 [Bacteroidales bacterium]|nr:hypothetical protein [Bacteroidales bacterium]
MKKMITVLVLALMVQVSFAQEEKVIKEESKSDMQTIFTKENLKVTGGYIAPELKMGYVHEDASLLLGAKLGMTFNNKFTLGVAGYGLTNNSNFDINRTGTPESARIGMGYGGLALEYTLFSDKKIHFSIPVVVGVAGIYVYEDDGDYFNSTYDEIENSAALVVEPGINIELNLFKFFRIDLGASYRLVSQTDLVYLQDEDLSDLTINATFKFGFF